MNYEYEVKEREIRRHSTAAGSTVNENNKIYVVEDDTIITIIMMTGKGSQVSRDALKVHRTYWVMLANQFKSS